MPVHAKPIVDAVIVTWNSGSHLGKTLKSLPNTVRAIVVDNASVDNSVEIAREHGATVVSMSANLGFPIAVNRGLLEVVAPITLVLNPDLAVGEGTIERCASVLDGDPTIGIVGPATTLPDGRPEPAAARHDRQGWHVLIESLGLVRLHRCLDRQMVHERSVDRDVDAVNGAFMMMRTDELLALGGLDETVFMYLEDGDLCRRVRDSGQRVRFVASAPAVHEAHASTLGADPDAQARAYLHRIDADLEFLRRYGRRGEVAVALWAFVLRSCFGLALSVVRPDRRLRYRRSLTYTLRQTRGRVPAPPV